MKQTLGYIKELYYWRCPECETLTEETSKSDTLNRDEVFVLECPNCNVKSEVAFD